MGKIFGRKKKKPIGDGKRPGGGQYKKPPGKKTGPVAKKPKKKKKLGDVSKRPGGGQYNNPPGKKVGAVEHKRDLMVDKSPVDSSRSATAKKGKAKNMPYLKKEGYAKKHGLTKSAQMHYMENELYNEKHGHPIAAKHDAHVLRKHWTKNM